MRNPPACLDRLQAVGINTDDATALRRISMTLHRWHELECGIDGGCIERGHMKLTPLGRREFISDENGKPYWANHNGERTRYTPCPTASAAPSTVSPAS